MHIVRFVKRGAKLTLYISVSEIFFTVININVSLCHWNEQLSNASDEKYFIPGERQGTKGQRAELRFNCKFLFAVLATNQHYV